MQREFGMNEKHLVKCNICKNASKYLFNKKLLNKYEVAFFQCENCKFIQSEKPYWLDEAYSSAIADLDIGLVYRNVFWAPVVENILKKNFHRNEKFIDFGGGYGLFVRLMRDRGLDFYRQDIYCENVFAKYFDVTEIKITKKFEVLTAFEVFEHLTDPIREILEMFKLSDSVLFSTELQPSTFKTNITKRKLIDWHYFTPETGQHVSLYHLETLKYIADKLGKKLFTDGQYLHLFTDKNISNYNFSALKYNRYIVGLKNLIKDKIDPNHKQKQSLLRIDYEFIKNKNVL